MPHDTQTPGYRTAQPSPGFITSFTVLAFSRRSSRLGGKLVLFITTCGPSPSLPPLYSLETTKKTQVLRFFLLSLTEQVSGLFSFFSVHLHKHIYTLELCSSSNFFSFSLFIRFFFFFFSNLF
ncbi:hypothetical protein BDW02DRAFT_335411 [Decorospora gaudefroyi]|uniref:Transmembrane protein n=1 Tax=Decorospora gaudefroyi TaxID=184978 RepID=A0A6A5KAV7_9PLEO|nr:hypothetical protein BDW02DRAFT_335411 [Decorospora gaudefroyi]